jgi:phage terminase small subunit
MADQQQQGLNDKQALFVQEYLVDLNATQAAIRAGYSENTAQEQGSRLLSNVMVQQAVAEGKRLRAEKTGIDAEWVLRRLAEEAEADIADLYSEDGGLRPVHQWPAIWRKGLVSGIKVHQEYDYVEGEKVPAGVVKEVKLSDRIKRIELIGKHVDVAAFTERLEHTGRDGGPIETKDLSANDIARRIAFALQKGLKAQSSGTE